MNKLKQVLAQEDTVLFIGSGISLWSGLPPWSGLIEELAKFLEAAGTNADLVRKEVKRGDLLQAASYGFDKLTKHQIGEFIRTSCRYGIAEPCEIHKKIISLGPRCYITTNYDNLLEEALRRWQQDRFFRPPITNRHLTECAEIVHARAIDFVFKPHGDAADSESIILTREQYRQLLPQGERNNALESLKMLLASRPVVYFGFGLRDPDFIYLRDLLSNTYKGGIRDHYAIMADVTDSECDYWRRAYGIHLSSYATKKRPDDTIDHSALLALLDALIDTTPLVQTIERDFAPDLVLSLARYAAGLSRIPKVSPEFPIRVHREHGNSKGNDFYYQMDKFDRCPVEKFLDEGPERALLIGLPGAGKTYSLRQAAARFSGRLNETCLSEPFDEDNVVIPIYVDLKLYQGNLTELVSQALPKNLSLRKITSRFRSKIFLDSFNEIPREYWENGTYEADFANFTDSMERASIIIGSRTNDGLKKLDFPSYCLDQIDEELVSTELQRIGIGTGDGRFDREIRLLLQKPFYFQLIKNGSINLSEGAHPRDFYKSFFENLHQSFAIRFGKELELEEILALAAYDAINRGEEAFPLSGLLQVLKVNIEAAGFLEIDSREVVNWLVSTSVLIPYIGGRIAFVHQSITEYLAAKELARLYQLAPKILKEKLALTRWDQALFLTLSLLPESHAETFFHDVIKTDLELALTAVKYLEVGRDNFISKLLAQIPDHVKQLGPYEGRIESILGYSLPLSENHEPQLRALMKLGNTIGGAAVKRLVEMKGSEVKDELLDSMVESRSDYNYCCNGIAYSLKPLANSEDVNKVAALSDSIAGEVTSDSDDAVANGFISGAAMFLSGLEISDIKAGLLPCSDSEPLSEIRARILCNILMKKRSTAALDLAGELLLRGVKNVATSIYFIGEFSKPDIGLSWASFTEEHVGLLVSMSDNEEQDYWWYKALRCVCNGRQDLAKVTIGFASKRVGIAKAVLWYCAIPSESRLVFEVLEEIVKMDANLRANEPIHLLKQIDINWKGHEDLFIKILRLRDSEFAYAIIDQIYHNEDLQLSQLDFGGFEWWLDWIAEESDYWFKERMSWLLWSCMSKEAFRSVIAEFNKPKTKYRAVIARTILHWQKEITTDDFSTDAVSFLLADLSRVGSFDSLRGHTLGLTATEQFVHERLLPLVSDAKEPLLTNLKNVIRKAGLRHGRRYEF